MNRLFVLSTKRIVYVVMPSIETVSLDTLCQAEPEAISNKGHCTCLWKSCCLASETGPHLRLVAGL